VLQKKKHPLPVDALTGYAAWAKHYPAHAHNPLMDLEQRAMLSLLPPVAAKNCLDLACGSGRYLHLLQAQHPKSVVGIDYSADMLAQVGHGQKLARGPFSSLPFADETFDLIICGLSVGHEPNLDKILAEAGRVLRRGGIILYSDFHPFAALSGWQRSFTTPNGTTLSLEHYIHFYSDHLRACQAAGLTLEATVEPVGGQHAPPTFEHVPVVLVIRAAKIG
jgi:malonyl-CoA O-methyltransferase